jgi:hypothetical protein
MILLELLNTLLVLVAFMAHVITETSIVVNVRAFNCRNDVIFFVVVDGVCRLIAAHSSPFLTLAHHEHRISWGLSAYFNKGRMWSRLAGSVYKTESVFFDTCLSKYVHLFDCGDKRIDSINTS